MFSPVMFRLGKDFWYFKFHNVSWNLWFCQPNQWKLVLNGCRACCFAKIDPNFCKRLDWFKLLFMFLVVYSSLLVSTSQTMLLLAGQSWSICAVQAKALNYNHQHAENSTFRLRLHQLEPIKLLFGRVFETGGTVSKRKHERNHIP